MGVKCIYCGKGNGDIDCKGREVKINESDIIPFALSNTKLKCKNVCSIEHNSEFSNSFESYVIKNLSCITNHLNIKTRSKAKFASYDAILNIENIKYKKKVTSSDVMIGDTILTSIDEKYKIGPIDKIKNIKNINVEIKQIDLNNEKVEISIPINLEVFCSNEMYRMVSKIAYEWFCKVNNIEDKFDIFNNIIEFIVTGRGNENNGIATILSDEKIYNSIMESGVVNYGDHLLICYKTKDEKINVIYSLFGIVIYKIEVLNLREGNFNWLTKFFQKLTITGQNTIIKENDLVNFMDDLMSSSCEVIDINTEEVKVNNSSNNNILDKIFFFKMRDYFENIDFTIDNDKLLNLLLRNLNELFASNVIDKVALERFVKDYSLNEKKSINLSCSDALFWIKLYLVILIGENNYNEFSYEIINKLIKKYISSESNTLLVSDNLGMKIKDIILSKNNYINLINEGAKKITNWK